MAKSEKEAVYIQRVGYRPFSEINYANFPHEQERDRDKDKEVEREGVFAAAAGENF